MCKEGVPGLRLFWYVRVEDICPEKSSGVGAIRSNEGKKKTRFEGDSPRQWSKTVCANDF